MEAQRKRIKTGDAAIYLPDHVLDLVLCKLRLWELLPARSVCSEWKEKLSSRYSPLLRFYDETNLRQTPWLVLYYQLDDSAWLSLFDTSRNEWCKLRIDLGFPDWDATLICAVEGILGFASTRFEDRQTVIGNPLLGKWVKVEPSKNSTSSAVEGGATSPNVGGNEANAEEGNAPVEPMFLKGFLDVRRRTAYALQVEDGWTKVLSFKNECRHIALAEPPSNFYFLAEDKMAIPSIVFCNDETIMIGRTDTELDDDDDDEEPEVDTEESEISLLGLWKLNWFSKKWELLAEMSGDLLFKLVRGADYANFRFCSDGDNQIWFVLHGSRYMANYNLSTKAWKLLPGCPAYAWSPNCSPQGIVCTSLSLSRTFKED